MASAKLTSKGQITIPRDVRKALGLHTGDRLAFNIRVDGTVLVEAEKVDLLSLRGIIRPKKRGISVEQMNEIIQRAKH
jgi:antitoxin PrlF